MEADAVIVSNRKKMENKEIKILLAAPRGFCAGVVRAIDIVEKVLEKYGSPVYVRHEIVHNKHVVDELKKKGVIFVEELSEIEDKSRPVVFSAHGVPKTVPIEADNKKSFMLMQPVLWLQKYIEKQKDIIKMVVQ